MNENEIKLFSEREQKLYDASSLPFAYLIKCVYAKIRRKLWGQIIDKNARLVWTPTAVNDVFGPADNVRNYLERKTIRDIIQTNIGLDLQKYSACEIGCGYGRLIMVLGELFGRVVGFERENMLVSIARELQPEIDFCKCGRLSELTRFNKGKFDFVMTCTVLQHLNDEFCREVLGEIKRLAPGGYVLLIEKTTAIFVTDNTTDGSKFISRARPVDTYIEWMKPFMLVEQRERVLERIYSNKQPGTCMLFKSPFVGEDNHE